MLRAPFIALLALLAGAALACSDTVPPPGATLAGFVYHDANANGVRDSCDSGEPPGVSTVVVLRDSKTGQPTMNSPATNGSWSLDNVPPGDYSLGLDDPPGTNWVVTGPVAPIASSSYELSVRGYETRANLDFGVAETSATFAVDGGQAVNGLLFEDLDGNGTMDQGECPLISNDPITGAPAYYLDNSLSDSDIPLLDFSLFRMTTRGISEFCAERSGQSGRDTSLLRPIGVQKATGLGSITIGVFNDIDKDGQFDETEPPIVDSKVEVRAMPGRCLFGKAVADPRASPSELSFSRLPTGEYVVFVAPPATRSGVYIVGWSTGVVKNVELGEGAAKEVDFGFHIPIPSTVNVTLIEDLNGDGLGGVKEPPVAGMPICYYPTEIEGDGNRTVGGCQETNVHGSVTMTGVYDANLLISVDPPASKEALWILPPQQEVTVGEGETVAITLLMRRR